MSNGKLVIDHILRMIDACFEDSNTEDQISRVLKESADQMRDGLLTCEDFSAIVEVSGYVAREMREKRRQSERILDCQRFYEARCRENDKVSDT